MRTTLYLIRHAATPANLAHPAKLQGRRSDPPLAPLGVQQACATRDFLAIRAFDVCYCSPLLRAVQTAQIVSEPHRLLPIPIQGLTECDIGQWEGKSWEEISKAQPAEYQRFMSNPALHGYLGGENFAQVSQRSRATIDELLARHAGKNLVIVSHHIVNRTYLASLLGLEPAMARKVTLDNCGISVVVRENDKTAVSTLNGSFHLQGIAA
jgi:phosphoserine phosphatase